MKTVNKSVLIWYHPAEMYALVTDVAAYPEFLPWCDHAAVVSEDGQGMTAEVGIAMLPDRSAKCVGAAHTLYGRILDKIEAQGYDVFTSRASVSTVEKATLVVKLLLPR